jgi:hypothetical protein
MNTIHELLIGIGHPVTLQDRFSQPTQHASFDGAKPQPMDHQGSGFPDDFILKEEFGWLEGMVSKIRFQLQEWIEPVAVTCENGRSVVEYSEGSFFSFRFRHGLSFL